MKFLLLLFILTFASPAYAEDEGLYDPKVPDKAALVRFIHADPHASESAFRLNNKKYDTLTFKDVSDYYVMPQGEAEVTINKITKTKIFEARTFYSVIKTPTDILILEDQPLEDITKALITFYNLTPLESLTLATTEKNITLVENLMPAQNAARAVNALTLNLTIINGNETTAIAEPVMLARRSAHTILALSDKDGTLTAVVTPSAIDTTK